ncbi:hypothetical protein GGS21DRAFT_502089 [Xylaria nigripes]|nr:hypothetical protein GGS21DRAFT_502089 [Xylaria nigripes]
MSYESPRSSRGGIWGRWVPLALTITVATVGVAAWAWSQRSNEEVEDEENEENEAIEAGPPDLDYENADYGENPPYGASNRGPRNATTKPSVTGDDDYDVGEEHPEASDAAAGWSSQMSGALRRTPSPQQFFSNAGKTVAAGVAGVGAAVGSALAAIREEDRNAYADHETWSEEAEARKEKPSAKSSARPQGPRKTVVLVVSADMGADDSDGDGFREHASILSHIPKNTDLSKIQLFVLIYAPGIKEASAEATGTNQPGSLGSSFSSIGHDQAQMSGEESKSSLLAANSANSAFNAAYSQALTLVEKETMVMPFTTPAGYTHMLRHLEPEVVYLQASLAGENGRLVTQLQSWLRHDVILIVGADGGHGGLVDSESDTEHHEKREFWWQKEERVGRGRGVVVVDSLRVGDDWGRRVQGLE